MARRRNRPLKEELKDLFAMHRGERRGFAVLLALCLLGAAWVTWEQWIRPVTLGDTEQLELEWAKLVNDSADTKDRRGHIRKALHLFTFDPNDLPVEQWMELGLTERQAGAIHRYEERGGRFRTKADLAKMRVVDPSLFAQWSPYIQLPDSLPHRRWSGNESREGFKRDTARWKPRSSGHDRSTERGTFTKLELNSADSAALVAVRGIGPSFARSILRYRDRLGGFASVEQLAEVPILRDKPDAVQRLREQLSVDPGQVRRIPLNSCTVEQLGPHPYIGWKVAKALVAYRNQHGPFKNVADISGCALVTDSIRSRIAPYLTVEE